MLGGYRFASLTKVCVHGQFSYNLSFYLGMITQIEI